MLKSADAPRTPWSLSVRVIVSAAFLEKLPSIFIAIAFTKPLYMLQYTHFLFILYPEQRIKSKQSAEIKLTLVRDFVILIHGE